MKIKTAIGRGMQFGAIGGTALNAFGLATGAISPLEAGVGAALDVGMFAGGHYLAKDNKPEPVQ